MTNVGNEGALSLSRLELVVLARLSSVKPPSEKDIGDAVVAFVLPAESPARAREVAGETIAALHRRGLVADRRPPRRTRAADPEAGPRPRPKKSAASQPPAPPVPGRKLTDEGRRALCAALALDRTPRWTEVRDKHLPALALGLAPGSDEASRALVSGESLAAAVLRHEYRVVKVTTVTALCDLLIAAELGMPPGPMTLQRIRAHVLARCAGTEAKGKPEQIAARAAAAVVRARRGDKRSLLPALARRWASAAPELAAPTASTVATHAVVSAPAARAAPFVTSAPAEHAAPSMASDPAAPAESVEVASASAPVVASAASGATAPVVLASQTGALSADALLTAVREAIPTIGADGRFGPEKVFISAIWHRIEQRAALDVSLERFKKWLLVANRDRLLDLARADLVGAMDPQLVAESEIEDLGSTFHFVLDRRAGANGVHGSERRSHAG